MQRHLGGDPFQCFHLEVGGTHPRLYCAKRMLDRFTPLTHLLRVLVQALLDSFKNMLVFPTGDPAFLAGRAAIPDGASLVSIGPIAVQRQSLFFIGEVVD